MNAIAATPKEIAIKGFVQFYFETEATVFNKESGTAKFEEHHKIMIVARLRLLMKEHSLFRRNVVQALAAADTKDSKTDRHEWRLNTWLKQIPEQPVQAKPEVVAKPAAKPVQAKPAQAKPVGSAPVTTPVTTPGDLKTFCSNLTQTVKSVCRSGLKNNLSTAEIQNILGVALKEAGDEHKVEQNQMKFAAFMHTNNIDKNTALDILQRM